MTISRRHMLGLLSGLIVAGFAGCNSDNGNDTPYQPGGQQSNPPPVMGSAYSVRNLVSDGTITADYTDPNLVNGWGVAFNPNGFVWVSAAGTSKSTLYDGNGVPQSLVVTIPDGVKGEPEPTGIVYNGSQDFKVSGNGVTAASPFIFASEAGTISGWAPSVNRTSSVTVYDGGSADAIYKGLAIASSSAGNRIYAADFHNNRVDVFDANFAKISVPGGFNDPTLPAGYAPFGIQAINNVIYVAYAKQDAAAEDEEKGAGFGYVNTFDADGNLIKHLIAGGPLNAPWGIAMAPGNFGAFGNALLVGNFGDGKINAFDPATGALMGTLSKADGTAIVIDGLWGIAFGNGINNQPTNTLFFAAGPDDENHGLYGRIDTQ